jgi:hypothetical protein
MISQILNLVPLVVFMLSRPTNNPSKPFAKNVTGAYAGQPRITSANAEPTPPAKNPPIGPNRRPLIITSESPRLKYPWVDGKGITRIAVATVVSAVSIAMSARLTVGFEMRVPNPVNLRSTPELPIPSSCGIHSNHITLSFKEDVYYLGGEMLSTSIAASSISGTFPRLLDVPCKMFLLGFEYNQVTSSIICLDSVAVVNYFS